MYASRQSGETQEQLNTYYQESLQSVVDGVFDSHPNLRQIVVSDRAPVSSNPLLERVSSKPMTLFARR